MVKLFRAKRSLSSREKLNAVFATFGSLSNFSLKTKASFAVIGREIGMKSSTLSELIYRLKGKYSCNLEHFIAGAKRTGRPRRVIGSDEIEKYLISSECLHDWMHLTLN